MRASNQQPTNTLTLCIVGHVIDPATVHERMFEGPGENFKPRNRAKAFAKKINKVCCISGRMLAIECVRGVIVVLG